MPHPPRSLHFAGTKFLRCLYNEGTSSGHPQNQLSKPLLALDPELLPRNTFPLKLSRQEEANNEALKPQLTPRKTNCTEESTKSWTEILEPVLATHSLQEL